MTLKFEGSATHDLSQLRQSAAGQAKLQRFVRLLDPRPSERILDLGCGSGEFCRMLVPHVEPGGYVTGVDPSLDNVQLSIALSAKLMPGPLDFIEGDGHMLDHEAASFDAAACISVLAFCHDPVRVLGELYRVLRPGGRLLLVNSDDDSRFFNCHDHNLGRRIQRAIADRCVNPWAGRRLAYWLDQAGFAVVQERVHTELEWDYAPGHAGYHLARSMRDYAVNQQDVCAEEYDRWLEDLQTCAQEGAYCYGVISHAYVAAK